MNVLKQLNCTMNCMICEWHLPRAVIKHTHIHMEGGVVLSVPHCIQGFHSYDLDNSPKYPLKHIERAGMGKLCFQESSV